MAGINWINNLLSRMRGKTDVWLPKVNYMVGQSGPVWLDCERPYELYNTIPQLKNVVDKVAIMFSNGQPKLRYIKDGKPYEDKDFLKLINNPNPLQSMNDFLRNMKTQELVYGNQFVYKNKPTNLTPYPVSLVNISPRYLQPVLTGKVFDQVELSGIVKEFEYYDNATRRKFKTEEIIWTKHNDLDNPVLGVSPIISLRYPVTNIKHAYAYRNVIMSQKGAIGILSSAGNKDSDGAIPLDKNEKARIQDQYLRDYGIQDGQSRVLLTEAALSWTPMTYQTKDLLLFEEVNENHLTIADHFGVNRNLYKDSTFENLKHGMIMTYQDTIIPQADQWAQRWTKELRLPEGIEIYMDYSHISILKADVSKDVTNFKTASDAIAQLVNSQIITPQQGMAALISLLPELNFDQA